MKNKRFFPMFVDLSDKKIVVVGGGNIATRRIKTLLQFTRNITAVAPKTTMELHELGKAGFVNLINRPVKRSDFTMAFMVIAATNDWKLSVRKRESMSTSQMTRVNVIFISREFICRTRLLWELQQAD